MAGELERRATGASPPPDFVGRGFAFPLAVDSRGGLALVGGAAGVESAMRVILSTAPGERVMRPEFGCRIWNLIFEPVTAGTLGLMTVAVRDAIAQWEPRVDVEEVDVVPDSDRPEIVRIHVTYRVRATNDRRNLVHPFYVIPQEGDDGASGP